MLDDWQSVPERYRNQVERALAAAEKPLAWFRPDLDARLDFADGLVVCTDRRLIAVGSSVSDGLNANESGEGRGAVAADCHVWSLDDVTEVRFAERLGYGVLGLHGRSALLAQWHFTATQLPMAAKFVSRLEDIRSGRRGVAVSQDAAEVCPSCGTPFLNGEKRCPVCQPAPAPPPVRSLWRLSRFARPRARWLALGISLDVGGHGGGPRAALPDDSADQQRAGAVSSRAECRLRSDSVVLERDARRRATGLGAWLGQDVSLLAKLGEQVSADIRNETYDHLQRLSLEFFGGKRTGDLISRISSDTDRICNFISVNLVDFCTDVVMIVMTSGASCCGSIRPWRWSRCCRFRSSPG